MTPGDAGQAEAATRPGRDFDGGLLSRITYTLQREDALAYLRLRRELSGRAKVLLALWFLLGGAAFGLLPGTITGAPDSLRFIAVFLAVMAAQFGVLLLGRALLRRWQAARLVPRPRPAEFEEWIDCIAGTGIDSADCVYLSPELIGAVIDTPRHLFVLSHDAAIVVPLRAFADAAALRDMARHLRELAAGPYYFDA